MFDQRRRRWADVVQMLLQMFCAYWFYSVVILSLNPRKSRKIAHKGFMIYYGRYRSQLAILKNPKQNSCSNLLH